MLDALSPAVETPTEITAPVGAAPFDPSATEPSAADPSAVDRPTITWSEPQESFLILAIRNFGLTLATFGLYHFWARVETRRRVHRAIHIDGVPLDYTGSGREGLISFLIGALVAVSIVSTVLITFPRPDLSMMTTVGSGGVPWRRFLISFPLMFLLGSIAYRKRKEVLRRTWWRGERFDLRGEAWSYAWLHFWTAFLVPITLGWAAPWRASILERRKINEMQHGSAAFRTPDRAGAKPIGKLAALSDGATRQLYVAFAKLWICGGLVYFVMLFLLAIFVGDPVIASVQGFSIKPMLLPGVAQKTILIIATCLIPCMMLITAYYAAWLRHQVSNIGNDNVTLSLALPTWPFIKLVASNAALRVGTLGALAPVADARFARFLISHTEVRRPVA
jgi:uncharacterized membrane protein YjgN (DUF898 family)